MKKMLTNSRRARHARLSVILTLLVVTVTVLLNTVFGTLANRYGWYSDMTAKGEYVVSEDCYRLLDSAFEARRQMGEPAPIKVMFCAPEGEVRADAMLGYLYSTVASFAERYPRNILVECHDILTNPGVVKPYLTGKNPVTGEEAEAKIQTSSIVIASGEYHRVYALTEFFSFKGGDTSTVWAYNGEKKLTAGVMHAINPDKPVACLTENHGEVYYDYELMYLLDDAGYVISHIDLQTEPIPENCDLLISYNPNSDLVEDGVSSANELSKIESFLQESGNSFFVFMESGTPSLPNYEKFLGEWGVSFGYYEDIAANRSYRYTVQDAERSLTSDHCTIYGIPTATGRSAEILAELNPNMIFQNATALGAAQGFVNNGDGSYTKGKRAMYGLYESSESATCWANGEVRDGGGSMLMTLTEQTNPDGKSSVGVIASARFCTEEFLQSAVYGNTDGIFRLLSAAGKVGTPEGLPIKPFHSLDISIVTTAELLFWALTLSLIPFALVTLLATVILIKRRNR